MPDLPHFKWPDVPIFDASSKNLDFIRFSGPSESVFQELESYAANRLRLPEQEPTRLVYLTSSRTCGITSRPITIELRHRAARKLTSPSAMSAMVFSALRDIGKTNRNGSVTCAGC